LNNRAKACGYLRRHPVARKRLPNDLKKILEFLEPWREELAGVVVESTYNWYWLVDGLQEAGFEVKLANTWAIKTYDGLKHSGDKTDARHLAHLLRLGLLPTGSILPPEQRALRDLARKRMQRVRSRTSHLCPRSRTSLPGSKVSPSAITKSNV
jgi:transposase